MEAVKNGAEEVDMVINIGALKDQNYTLGYEDIKAVVDQFSSARLLVSGSAPVVFRGDRRLPLFPRIFLR